MKVGLVTSLLSSAAGGLSACVPNIAFELENTGRASVQTIGVQDPANPNHSNQWGPNVYASRGWGPKGFAFAPGLSKTLEELQLDLTEVQGLWTFASWANLKHHRRTGLPYLVAPHGMLDPWARERSRFKKRVVERWFEREHLRRARCLRATAEMEAGHFREYGLVNPIAVIPNGIRVPEEKQLNIRKSGRRKVLFLSRVHPKKGIPNLLRAWQAIERARTDWELMIVGPDELGHTREMKQLARSLKLNRVSWSGAVYGEAKSQLYQNADLFVLPTHAENFGIVIAEALAHRVPVITTTNAPWEGLLHNQCGWWIPLDDERLSQTIRHATSLKREQLEQMGQRGRQWMQRDFSWEQIAAQTADLFEWVLSGGPPPKYVHT